jgi:HK97 family phage portal protein
MDVLHFKNYSMDGVQGVSTIKQNALSIGMGLKLKEYNSKIIGERPYGFLTTEAKPKDLNMKTSMQGLWNKKVEVNPNAQTVVAESTSVGGVHLPILYGGVEFKQLSLPADDVAYIESTNLTNKDIYGIFRVPPTFGQDWENTPYNGAEQQDIVFAKYTLASLREMEQECTEKLFPINNRYAENAYYAKFNLKGILAGDSAARREFYAAMFNIAVLNANEIREMEDLTTYEGGDEYYIQGALVPVSKIAEFIDSKIQSSKNKDQTKSAIKSEVKSMLRDEAKKRLNGHFNEIKEIFE